MERVSSRINISSSQTILKVSDLSTDHVKDIHFYIKKGEIVTDEIIMAKRPANGISPMRWFEVVGTKAVRDFMEDEPIEL